MYALLCYIMLLIYINVQAVNELFSHIKLTIYPDGGVMRLRIYGMNGQLLSSSTATNSNNDFKWSKL